MHNRTDVTLENGGELHCKFERRFEELLLDLWIEFDDVK